MIQGNPGTFRGNRKPAWQQLRHNSNCNMSGWTIITPHLDTGPNKEQVFGPILAPYLSVCVSVFAHMLAWVDEKCMRTCVPVSVCGLCLSLSLLATCQCKCDSRHFIMGRVCHIHHYYACCSVPVCQCVFTLSHIVRVLL